MFVLSILFCSGASSIAWDHIYVPNNSSPRENRLVSVMFRPLYTD